MNKETRNDGIHAFIERLYALEDRDDRQALAALRRSLQDPHGMAAAACPYVVPFLPHQQSLHRERSFFLVAALFSLARAHASGVSVGHALRQIQRASGDGDNPSLRLRFAALLDAHPEDVGEHIRHVASLARAHRVALDWELLLRDLTGLYHPERRVQRRWAREFWGQSSSDDSTSNAEEVTS